MEREKKSRPGSVTGEHFSEKVKLSPKNIKISIGDTVIVADKQNLIDASPFFASLLRFHADDDLEARSLVPPENADFDCFAAMLSSLTNSSAKLNITAENLWDCVVLSKYFQVEQIEEKCWKALRKMLPTLAMDELLRLWRHGHSCAIDKITTLVLVGISLKMEDAKESSEFLDFSTDQLVALMSDDGFLPLTEEGVCEAVKAWCEHDPENRKKKKVLKRVLAEVVWNESTVHVIQSISRLCREPCKMPKRTVNSDNYEIPDDELLKNARAKAGIIIGNFLYCLQNGGIYGPGIKSFCRIDMNERKWKREELTSMYTHLETDDNNSEAEYTLCLITLPGGDKIGCFGCNIQHCNSNAYDPVYNMANHILLYDIATGTWDDLPRLPLSRADCAMIQCGSFLYIIGGEEYQPMEGGHRGDNAQYCFRLDLIKSAGDQWEPIADLTAPRIFHEVSVQYGRIIVSAGETRTKVVDERYSWRREFEDARWSEAYDPTLNVWTVLKSAT